MKTLCPEKTPVDLLNICRICLDELIMERTSIFEDIEIQTMGKENNQHNDNTWLRIRTLDIILLCTSNITVNIEE